LKYFCCCLLVLSALSSPAQKLIYDIFLFGGKIGESLIEQKIVSPDETDYTLNSASEAHIFFSTRKITLHYDIVFKNDLFYSSFSKHTRNDEVQFTTITRDGNNYTVKRGKETFTLNGLIDCSTVKLFYLEPCSETRILSERLGEFRTIKKTSPGTYEAEMSEGITYVYRYKEGKLVELEMSKGILGSIYLRLRK
jgi:hypothetical protein